MNAPSGQLRRFAILVAASAAAGPAWFFAFPMWIHTGGYWLYRFAVWHLDLHGPLVEMASDLPFAVAGGLLLSAAFLRWIREHEYAAEAIAIPVFVAAVAATARASGEGTRYFVALPVLLLAVAAFAIPVGYGIQFRRCCAALGAAVVSCSAES